MVARTGGPAERYEPRGVCLECPHRSRCHRVRVYVIDQQTARRDACPFFVEFERLHPPLGVWRIERWGEARDVAERLRVDVARLSTDVPAPLHQVLVGFAARMDGVARVNGRARVRFRAELHADGRFRVEVEGAATLTSEEAHAS